MSTKLTLGKKEFPKAYFRNVSCSERMNATTYYFFPFIFISSNDTDHNCLFTFHQMN